ncbi:DUF692 family protein [Streptomyces sp. XM4193]|uniref:multinuclear nonheme iron-dependent oxidase n=1 Tax=Streptomyces sp. XM4193 TaxID=2929782 RepID=UPI001FFA0F1E|nr:DUF692 family multinuclear iron-containing protein [Streptomyces sp. XM4193]MCK1794883.1 DUF692 family protein [Streptomyces sp. XM4193]
MERLGLGLGLDLVWGERIGFEREGGGRPTDRVRAHLERYAPEYDYMFVAFQPIDYGPLDPVRYHRAYDRVFELFGEGRPRAFHQTMLNTGTPEGYEKKVVADFTNALTERYGFRWIIEDLGIWSLAGRSLPYPMPPVLTEEGLRRAVATVGEWVELLDAPLSVEFPGFTEGGSFLVGTLDAFEFYATVVRETGALATIDVGHVLAYQWLKGRTGDRMFDGLDALPLERCHEVHLSGCQIVGGRFRDLHHGVLLDEQLALLEHLLPRMPRLTGVTYEDPKFDADGELVPKSRPNAERLFQIVRQWKEPARDHS